MSLDTIFAESKKITIGNKEIENMKRELSVWMEENGYESISQFKGKLNASAAGDVNPFERTQFMKYYSSHE